MNFIVAGSAVLILGGQQDKPHIWFILTNPDEDDRVLVVMLRSRQRHTDNTTILAPGEYEFGSPVEGAIDYGETMLFPVTKLLGKIQNNRAQMRKPMTPDLHARVLAGACISGHTPNWAISYLQDLGQCP